jgi:23S rRNA (guanosine2251-2'-O)-methyltransferase
MQIEGRNPVLETLRAGKKISVLYIQHKIVQTEKIREILKRAQKKGIRIQKVGKNNLTRMSKTKVHQGVIAKIKYEAKSLREVLLDVEEQNREPFFIMTNEVLYQHNLGAIVRSAEVGGCNGVIVPLKTKITAEAVRASMGATEHIPIIKENIFSAVKILTDEGIKIVGLEASGDTYLYDEDLTGPICILIGGENIGITRALIKKCHSVLKIPIFGKINSLNMSNAAAVAIFEKVRQELKER